ncbi:MAG: dihydrolipoamide acetyltransferase family protein [Xanthomonadaceae bacterium]|nr:dihydrolipoamide acetyltransferase family protein [Xanthomonadaceae bacterium]
MTQKTFHLPDLGEGLPDATIVDWMVKEGDVVRLDDPLVSMETAKAVVEVPAPCSGKVLSLAGGAGDVIATGAVLATFELDPNLPQRAEGHDTGHHHAGSAAAAQTRPAAPSEPTESATEQPARPDAGTVVGAMETSDRVHTEQASSAGGVKAMPAVRALARKLKIDLSRVTPSGEGGVITLSDVKAAAAAGSAASAPGSAGKAAASGSTATAAHATSQPASAQRAAAPEGGRQAASRTAISAAGRPMRTLPPGISASGQPEPLRGVRRNMARVMADAHAKVVPTTLSDDADIQAWAPGNDITVRLCRAIVAACRTVPALNAWFDGATLTRTLHPHVDIGIAVDTDDGLFVPALRNADLLDASATRAAVDRLRAQVADRSIPASELAGHTISLSNFGMFAGRYATPIIVPPTVAIVAAGRGRHQTTPVVGGFESRKVIPLSLTFDHRACTGGEAARFLRALMDDLSLAG